MQREADEGVVIDPITGYPLKLEQRDAPVEFLADMVFWLHLDRELVGARNENGFVIPSEIYQALDRWGIEDEENRDTAKLMLDCIATGRNSATMEKIEKPTT